jgi:ABC-2 type transport system ATP-binding protein
MKNGSPVVRGNLHDIKKSFPKHSIFLKGILDEKALGEVMGVKEVKRLSEPKAYRVLIENEKVVDRVFDFIKSQPSIEAFLIEEPTLNEIFIQKVGESND